MEITVKSRETIKPSSPTPNHLRHFKLSLIDQFMSRTVHIHIILFYSSQGDVTRFQSTNMSDQLKESLSQVLTEFYPVAGTFMENQWIECNDVGLEYIEARVKAPYTLGRLLSNPQSEELIKLFPYDVYKYGTDVDFKLMAVKVTVFDGCGGMAISVSISHALADGSSLAFLVSRWAAIARGDRSAMTGENIPSPKFGFASLFPPRDNIPVVQISDIIGEPETGLQKLITKRFVFNQTNINAIKANFHASSCPTRVEAVSALIFKCLIKVAKAKSSKPVMLTMGVDARSRMTAPVPVNYFGNMALVCTIEHTGQDSLNDLGVLIRESIKQVNGDCIAKLQANNASLLFEAFKEQMNISVSSDVRAFTLASFCKFSLFEMDVGWGVPTWAVSFFPAVPDAVLLVDAKSGGGIEAWVTLKEDDMARFESDSVLVEFTVPNLPPQDVI